ncbi:MAG: ClbS/DfsB family four-helix bundle protein, partial [Chloroflexota bacterium]|nr:ClbS/DfsB family four-helix bundle protein [Chloroflexota bacterium]
MTEAQSIPANKAELLDDLNTRWNAFVVYVDSLPHEQWTGPTDPAGWTVSDHVAHVTAWDRAVVELFRDRTPEQRTLGVTDAAWATGTEAINEEIRQRTVGRSIGTVKTGRDEVFAGMLEAVSGFSDEDLERPGGEFGLDEDGKCLREVLVSYLGGHYDEHRQY